MSNLERFDLELKELDRLAEAGYLLALHIRYTTPLRLIQTHRQSWIDHYAENGYVLRDPLTAWCFSTTGAIRWSEVRVPDPFGIFREARRFGLNYGATVSHGPIQARTIGSLARGDREFTDEELVSIHAKVMQLHDLCEPALRLTDAQSEALRMVADGHRHAAAANLIGISESALKVRLSAARERLLARTTAEAIQRAKDHNLL